MKTRVNGIGQLVLILFLCLNFTACNEDEYFEKEYLDAPHKRAPNTDESGTPDEGGGIQGGTDSGVDGGTQGGGQTGGDTDGTDGGTTGGSSTGGTDGGSTTGGSDGGSTTGGTDGGSTTGGSDGGSTTGGSDGGSTTGGSDGGSTTGGSDGGDLEACGNNGHGNNIDGVDSSNPGKGSGGPNGAVDPSGDVDDEKNTTNCAVTEIFQQKDEKAKLDILWIIDDSGSMADEQSALGQNFDAFIKDFISTDADFKMAITTTDVSSSTKSGKMVAGSDTMLTSAKAKENEAEFMANFNSMVQVGTRGSGYEKGLAASEAFMTKHSANWMRSDAYLAVVVLSDEEDQSSNTPEWYLQNLLSYKPHAGLVKVYSIVDKTKSNTGYGITTGYERYAAVSEGSNGIVADIRQDFAHILTEMGDSLINLLDSFALSDTPIDGSLQVFVNGNEVHEYSYDSASNSIKFNQGYLPPVGAEIKVVYSK